MSEETDEHIKYGAELYGITFEEAQLRHQIMMEHKDDPDDPICFGCAKRPTELSEYADAIKSHPDDEVSDEQVTRYCIENEGTYNRFNGHFLCSPCYIANGQPSSPTGWVCP